MVASGGMLNVPGCGRASEPSGEIPGDGVNVISTANRNFLGRMGNTKANIYRRLPGHGGRLVPHREDYGPEGSL